MTRTSTIALLTAFLICGCSGSNPVIQEQTSAYREAADVLSGVKDKASAQAALARLQPVAARLREAQKKQVELAKAGSWRDPSADEQKQLVAAVGRYTIEAKRLQLSKVDGAGDLLWLITTATAGLPATDK
jgi:uncharacterized protein YcfL